MNSMLQKAISEILEIVGSANILVEGPELNIQLQNTSHFSAPQVPALVRPANDQELDSIIQICRESSIPVYTFSKGLNWGLGSRLPLEDGCILLDLSRLNRILEINPKFHYAIVEPGVSQGELSAEIRRQGLNLMLNVTGSSPNSSVLANMLERGSGFLAHRLEDMRGLEVLLADGSKMRSGFWNDADSHREALHFSPGFGPDWTGIFSQSNLGIVTKAVVNLYPKLEFQKMLWCKVEQSRLPELVEAIGELYKRKYISSVTHIGNDKRMKIEHRGADKSKTWTSFGSMVQGTAEYVEFLEKEIPRVVGNRCLSLGFYNQQESEDAGLGAVFGCSTGTPTDYFLKAMYMSEDMDPDDQNLQIDHGPLGMLCCLPVLPLQASAITDTLEILDSIYRDFGIMPATTLNPMNDLCLESVINIYFRRNDPQAVANAHAANKEMTKRFYEAGFRFYRFDVKLMHEYINPENPHWKFVSRLKKALDPDRILSPGRYEPRVS